MAKRLKVTVDGSAVDSEASFHAYMREALTDLEYEGDDLKALEDVLLSAEGPVRLIIKNHDDLIASLGDYAQRLDVLLHEIAVANPNFSFKYK